MRLLLLVLFWLGACAADARAGDLARMDRTITKEPAYRGKPLYCLVALGPEPKERVWLVLDGETLYVDTKGSGDIMQAVRVTDLDGLAVLKHLELLSLNHTRTGDVRWKQLVGPHQENKRTGNSRRTFTDSADLLPILGR